MISLPNNKSQKDIRKAVWKKSEGRCSHCGRKVDSERDRTIDHVIPQAVGGTNDQRNLMPLCMECNRSKASGEIVPETYYRYANSLALSDLQSYIFEWKLAHTRSDGTLTEERYGIQE